MKLQNLTVIFVIIILPIILVTSMYISTGIKTIKYQSLYSEGLLNAVHNAVYAFEQNTINNELSVNAEIKRDILKSSIKVLERSLCTTCNVSTYDTTVIDQYIPAIVCGMYDGFYVYTSVYNSNTKKYEHNLKNYVYYSETVNDMIITYSLDNYITVSGNGFFKQGYLTLYNSVNITDTTAVKYYNEAYEFSNWFNQIDKLPEYLIINSDNNPEDENSAFVRHKRELIKSKIEGVLNSTITAYSKRTSKSNYKMPKLSEEDWEKIYNNISFTAFFQGKNVGLTNYNGYCVLNSTNNIEYVNPNLIYFIDENNIYHDIRCNEITKEGNNILNVNGYKIGDFKKIKTQTANSSGEIETSYKYKNDEIKDSYACYNCINGQQNTNNISIYDYIKNHANSNIKSAYYTSLAKERYNITKLLNINFKKE